MGGAGSVGPDESAVACLSLLLAAGAFAFLARRPLLRWRRRRRMRREADRMLDLMTRLEGDVTRQLDELQRLLEAETDEKG